MPRERRRFGQASDWSPPPRCPILVQALTARRSEPTSRAGASRRRAPAGRLLDAGSLTRPRTAAVAARVALTCLILALALGCGRPVSSGAEATYIPQPTPDRTVDTVVRGLASPVVFGSPSPNPGPVPPNVARPGASPAPGPARANAAARPPSTTAPSGAATPRPAGGQTGGRGPAGAGLATATPAARATQRPAPPAVINPTAVGPLAPSAPTRPMATPGR